MSSIYSWFYNLYPSIFCKVPWVLMGKAAKEWQQWVPSHGTDLNSNQILVFFFFFIYTSLYHYCFTMSCKQDTAVDGRVCIYVGVSVFPLILCRVPASTRHTSQFRFNVCTDLPSLCSTSCCLHQLDLMLVWDVTNSCLTITWIVWGLPWGLYGQQVN